ncbi:MAG: hypothetical protein SGJ01_09175 [Gemmatimonadota bacterium]|nr:hypothetical protein [Gemmatimonadota bacterium]
MPPNSEIEKLERRWKENPKGTVFAPYAEVLRKNGDVPLAIEALRQGLELHPDHIPGNIVLGRCQLDLGADGPAEAAFTHVLDLDIENVIALKALADITERQGRLMEASSWLERLISVDPSNDEARDQLTRVLAMREAAAAAITRPVEVLSRPTPENEAPLPPPAPVIQPATPAGLRSEAASGEIQEQGLEDDADIDSILDAFESPESAARPLPRALVDAERTVPSMPVLPRPPLVVPPLDLEPGELHLAEAAADLEVEPLEAIEPDEPFVAPAPIDLRPSSRTEFQEPDASEELLDLTPGVSEFQVPDDSAALLGLTPGTSEFQVPNASEELTLSSSGASEYQPPSGVDELLADVSARASAEQRLAPEPELESEPEPQAEPEPEPVVQPAPPKSWGGGVVTSGFAAIAIMPTEEMPTESHDDITPPEVPLSEAATAFLTPFPEPLPEPPATASGAGEVLEESAVEITESSLVEVSSESETGDLVEVDSDLPLEAALPAASVEESGEIEDAPASELHLIFPDDVPPVAEPRGRRLSQELAGPSRSTIEPASAEPEPVLTETMAELYARQGHVGEAVAVYRRLVERQPNDRRLTDRLRELEAMAHTGARRLSYIAMDTGGESVESFFRALVEARPMGAGASVPSRVEPDDGSGAPTRPASDPLSLSAIFGEESPQSAPPAEPTPPAGGSDAFSFDQFFGSTSSGSESALRPRGTGPGGEDLDQFQHWLKSLKR